MRRADDEEEEEPTIAQSSVRAKHLFAARFADQVLAAVIKECVVGKLVVELCQLGDKMILELTGGVFNTPEGKDKEKVEKGIAFPTCISVNHTVCHYSPVSSDTTTLKDGDVAKIDLGVHIDGFVAQVAHTVVVQKAAKPVTGKLADLMVAGRHCLDAALRMLQPGRKNNDIPPLWTKIAEQFGVHVAEGVLSHRLKKFVIDGNECILAKPAFEQRVEDVEFGENEVWSIDLLLTESAGKPRPIEDRPLVYKRCPDQQYMLRLKASKDVFREINQKFQIFPFSVRHLDSKTGPIGVSDCLRHDLLVAYPILFIKAGEAAVHLKCTVLISEEKTERVTGVIAATSTQEFKSEKQLTDPEILELLARPLTFAGKKGPGASEKAKKPKKGTVAAARKKEGEGSAKAEGEGDDDDEWETEEDEEEEEQEKAKAKAKDKPAEKKSKDKSEDKDKGAKEAAPEKPSEKPAEKPAAKEKEPTPAKTEQPPKPEAGSAGGKKKGKK